MDAKITLICPLLSIVMLINVALQNTLVGVDAWYDGRVWLGHVAIHFIQVLNKPIEELLDWGEVFDHESKESTFDKAHTLFIIKEVAVNLDMWDEEVECGTDYQVVLSRV